MPSEKEWVSSLVPRLESGIHGLSMKGVTTAVSQGMRLPYRYEVLTFKDNAPEMTVPSGYETDLLIYDMLDQGLWSPRVVIECKIGSVTTHDAITYSRKASTHKQVHPYLRYGILIGNWGNHCFPARLFRHGEHFDFMATWAGTEASMSEWESFVAVVTDEIRSAREVHSILSAGRAAKTDHTIVHRPLLFRRTT